MSLSRPEFWEVKNLISYSLLPISHLYSIIQELRFYFTKQYKSSIKTICVGNYTVGGSGKTPTVIEIAKYFKNLNKKVCIITRGYQGLLEGPVLVDKSFHNFESVGDEALILEKFAPVIVSKNKLDAIKFAENKGFEIAIFDDGLQNPLIDYDFRIAMFDSNSGNSWLIPSGPLRENDEKCMIRSDAIFSSIELPPRLKYLSEKWFRFTVETQEVTSFKHKPHVLFAAIGNPNKFFDYASSLGVNIIQKVNFPDHHSYTSTEIEELIKISKNLSAKLLTTEKDFVKIPEEYRKYISYLPIFYQIKNLDQIFSKLL